MALDSKIDKIARLLAKRKIDKAIKIIYKYPEDHNRFYKLAKILARLRRDVEENEKAGKIMMASAKDGDFETVVEMLLEGANVNIEDKWGSALLKAMFNKNYPSAEVLIHLGANVDSHDPSGETILMDAVVGDNIQLVRLLIKKGVNPFAKNKYHRTAKIIAKGMERKNPNFITREIISLLEGYETTLLNQAEQIQIQEHQKQSHESGSDDKKGGESPPQ